MSRKPMKASINGEEQMVVLGARLVRRTWYLNTVMNKEQLADLVAAALLLAGHPDLARRLKP